MHTFNDPKYAEKRKSLDLDEEYEALYEGTIVETEILLFLKIIVATDYFLTREGGLFYI